MSYSGNKIFGATQFVKVSKKGGDYNTLKEALTFVATVATTSKRWGIYIDPGDYTEDNPLNMPDYCSLFAAARHEATRILCANPGSHGIVLAKDMEIIGLQVKNASGAGSAGFYFPAGALDTHLHDCKIKDCDIGFLSDSPSTGNYIREPTITGGTCTSIIQINAGATLYCSGLYFSDGGGGVTATNGILIEGAGAFGVIQSAAILSGNITNGVNVRNGAYLQAGSVGFANLPVAIRVGPNGTALFSNAGAENCTLDVVLEAATSTVDTVASWLHSERISGLGVGTFAGSFFSDTAGDEGSNVFGEFHVGSKEQGAESTLGGGDSYFWGVNTFVNTNLEVGAWTDYTTEAQSSSGSTFPGFAGVGVDNCLYIGSDYPFPGLKATVTTAMVPGAGQLILEYWNGGVWVELLHMSSDGNAPYAQYADKAFERINSEQIRFRNPQSGWATKLLNGETKYWARYRITAAITSVPTIQQIKCHTHRTEVNADGFVEYFGGAQPVLDYPYDIRMLTELDAYALGNADLDYSARIRLNATDNKFNNGQIDGIGGSFLLKEGTSTCELLLFELYVMQASAGAGGNAELELVTTHLTPTDLLDGTSPEESTKLLLPFTARYKPEKFVFSINIEKVLPGDTIAFAILRDARVTNPIDTLNENVAIEKIRIYGTKWKG